MKTILMLALAVFSATQVHAERGGLAGAVLSGETTRGHR